MGREKTVYRCKYCRKIYPSEVPRYCKKCGIHMITEKDRPGTGTTYRAMTSRCEKVLAKRTLFGWKVIGDEGR